MGTHNLLQSPNLPILFFQHLPDPLSLLIAPNRPTSRLITTELLHLDDNLSGTLILSMDYPEQAWLEGGAAWAFPEVFEDISRMREDMLTGRVLLNEPTIDIDGELLIGPACGQGGFEDIVGP